MTDARAPFRGWRMVGICFLILNCTLGVNFAAYGALVEAIERAYSTSRALASMGISMVTLALGLLAPMVGTLMRRYPVRLVVMAGLVLNAGGFFLLAIAPEIAVFLALCLLLIGPGFALAGVVPCTAIVSDWFVEGRGRTLGIINMPFGNALMPLAAAWALVRHGLPVTLMAGGALLLALVPLAALLVEAPARPEQAGADPAGAMTSAQILKSRPFLVVTIGVTLLSAAGIVMVTHLIALATDRGMPLGAASTLLSLFGLAGLAGAPLFGWIADRIGGGRAFAVLALGQIVPWVALVFVGANIPALLACAFAIGLCCNGVLTLFGVTMGAWLGQANLGLGMGLCYLLQIPVMFAAAPLAGAMFDRFGSYTPAIALHVATFVAVGLMFLLYRPRAEPSIEMHHVI
ncbi:MAG: hypothetical protein RIS94_185 [Pseudomonadota bacterium]|jgi:MFS family permease